MLRTNPPILQAPNITGFGKKIVCVPFSDAHQAQLLIYGDMPANNDVRQFTYLQDSKRLTCKPHDYQPKPTNYHRVLR